MENVNITEEQAKSLKLFAFYAQGYGKKEVNTSIYTQECTEDWRDHEWYGDGNTRVESYDAIDNVIDDIITENDLISASVSDCDNRGTLHINIDCVERTLKIDASERVYETRGMGDSLELSDIENENLKSIFEYMSNEGYSEGVVVFAGGGDSGQIESGITYDSNSTEQVNRGVLDFLYRWLEEYYGGWEINEGSQGRFIFNMDDELLELEFEENLEEEYNIGQVFYTKF
jgi:hypothetical protein